MARGENRERICWWGEAYFSLGRVGRRKGKMAGSQCRASTSVLVLNSHAIDNGEIFAHKWNNYKLLPRRTPTQVNPPARIPAQHYLLESQRGHVKQVPVLQTQKTDPAIVPGPPGRPTVAGGARRAGPGGSVSRHNK